MQRKEEVHSGLQKFFSKSSKSCFSVALMVKNLPANAEDVRDMGSIPGSGRFPGEGNGNPLQYPCLENFIDRGTWQTTVHGVAKSWIQLSG